MIVQNIKDLCWRLSKNMRIPKTPNWSRISLVTTTFKWRKRFLLIPLMVPLVILGLGILILWLLQQLQLLVSYLFVGLKRLLTFILINCWRQRVKIMLSRLILIPFISLLMHLLAKCLQKELKLKKLSPSWTRLLVRSWNLLLIKVMRLLLKL